MNDSFKTEDSEFQERFKIAWGVLIAKGVLKKFSARDILIWTEHFTDISIGDQCIDFALSDFIINICKKDPPLGMDALFPCYWLHEALDRCTVFSVIFTKEEQQQVLAALIKLKKRG